MAAPHTESRLKRAAFMDWLHANGAELREPTNPYEVLRYTMFDTPEATRATTHIIYRRANGQLSYVGQSRQHYEAFAKAEGR